MSKKGLLAKEDHVITLMLRDNVEQIIHVEPMDCGGLMVITMEPADVKGDKLTSPIMKIYSYSTECEYIFNNDSPIMKDGEDDVHYHIIEINIIKRGKTINPNMDLTEFNKILKINSQMPCKIWEGGDKEINDLILTRHNQDDGMVPISPPHQICKYRWVR